MRRSESAFVTGDTPLTDPRSLGSSVLFHGLFVLLGWLAVLRVAMPLTEPVPKPIRAEIGPVDNRADARGVAGEGGGSPGEMGGTARVPITSPDDRDSMAATSRDPADALLAEILPSSQPLGAGGAPEGPAGAADGRPGPDPGLGTGRRRGIGGRLGRRRRPRDRARHSVLRRPRSRPFLRLCDRLLGEHGQPQLAGDGQARAARQRQPAPAGRRVLRGLLQHDRPDAERSPGEQGPDGGDRLQQGADPGPARDDRPRRRHRSHVGPRARRWP